MTRTRRLQRLERRRRDELRAPDDDAAADAPELAPELRAPAGDWGRWLLALAREYRLVQHDDITGRLAVFWAGAWEHPNLAAIERLVNRLNELAREHNTVILLTTRDEVDAALGALDAGRLDVDVRRDVAGGQVGADLVLSAPYDPPEPARRAASDASAAMRAFVLATGRPWPTDLAGARELLETVRDYAIA